MLTLASAKVENKIFTVPNVLSMLRILLIPIYARIYLTAKSNSAYYIATAIMVASVTTDAIDGFIARKYHMITKLGKALDPIADKLTQTVILACLTVKFWQYEQFIMLVGVFFGKELFMLIMGILCLKKGRMLNGALFVGKTCTTVLFVCMGLFMLFPNMNNSFVWALSVICTAAMLVSLGFYISTYRGVNHGVQVVPLSEDDKT